MNKLCFHDSVNKNSFILFLPCFYVADPATLFSPENSLFTQLWKKINVSEFLYHYLINMVNINILSLNFNLQNYIVPL